MGRMHRPDDPNTDPGSQDGGDGRSTCPVCGDRVSNARKPRHIAVEHGQSEVDDARE